MIANSFDSTFPAKSIEIIDNCFLSEIIFSSEGQVWKSWSLIEGKKCNPVSIALGILSVGLGANNSGNAPWLGNDRCHLAMGNETLPR